jgi:hypothetical protein
MVPVGFGQIVLANVSDGHGNTKVRPIVIVTPTDEIVAEQPIRAVCISTQIEDPVPPEHIELPWSNPRHPRTGLNKRNVAKCNWLVTVSASDVIEVRGFVPAKAMARIQIALKSILGETEQEP